MVTQISPEDQARDLMKFLQNSNLHFTAQVTPFSLYITVRKKFRNNSNLVIQDQSPQEPPNISIPQKKVQTCKSEFENQLNQSARNLKFQEICWKLNFRKQLMLKMS
jgi:hypothetical protein